MSKFNSHTGFEIKVPRTPEVRDRLLGFYAGIGAHIQESAENENDLFVWMLPESRDQSPVFSYWLSENEGVTRRFRQNPGPYPSEYSAGLALPGPEESDNEDVYENSLNMPDNDAVRECLRRGGQLLRSHLFVELREHPPGSGRDEFRFLGPLRERLRVTVPGEVPEMVRD